MVQLTRRLSRTGRRAVRFGPGRVRSWLYDREGMRDQARVLEALPDLSFEEPPGPDTEAQLRQAYERYVVEVSSLDWAMSWEAARFLWVACTSLSPQRVADFGSGFSTLVLGLYQRRRPDVEVCSIDDSPDWLDRTRGFLAEHGLSSMNLMTLDSFQSAPPRMFDLIFYDLGLAEDIRTELFEETAGRLAPGGVMILDDIHKPAYRQAVFHKLERLKDLRSYSLRAFTGDLLGRHAQLLVKAG